MTSTKQPPPQQGTMQAASAPALRDDDEESLNQQLVVYRDTQPFLTPAMQQFAEHWALNRNQVKAYQHAFPGSSVNAARTEARRLFADPRVQAEILRVIDNWTDKSGTTIAQLEHELARLARSDARRLFGPGATLLDPHQWDADTAAAVASYSETPTKYGIVRKVRLHDKNSAARTLLEAKGAFEKQKAPPGAAAIFNINLGGVPLQLGAPVVDGRTLTMDMRPAGKGKKSPAPPMGRGRKAEKRPNRLLAHPVPVSKPRQKASEKAESDEISTLSTDKQVADQHTVEISTGPAKPDLF